MQIVRAIDSVWLNNLYGLLCSRQSFYFHLKLICSTRQRHYVLFCRQYHLDFQTSACLSASLCSSILFPLGIIFALLLCGYVFKKNSAANDDDGIHGEMNRTNDTPTCCSSCLLLQRLLLLRLFRDAGFLVNCHRFIIMWRNGMCLGSTLLCCLLWHSSLLSGIAQ